MCNSIIEIIREVLCKYITEIEKHINKKIDIYESDKYECIKTLSYNNKIEIYISTNFFKNLYNYINNGCIDNLIDDIFIKNKPNIYSLKCTIYTFSLLIIFAHEIGHIVQGHFNDDNDNNIEYRLCEEYDADIFAGVVITYYYHNLHVDYRVVLFSILFIYSYTIFNNKSELYPCPEIRSILLAESFMILKDYTMNEFSDLNNNYHNININFSNFDEIYAMLNRIVGEVFYGQYDIIEAFSNITKQEWIKKFNRCKELMEAIHIKNFKQIR